MKTTAVYERHSFAMNSPHQPEESSDPNGTGLGRVIFGGAKVLDLLIYSCLLFQVWIAASGACSLYGTKYFTSVILRSVFLSLAMVACGVLLWRRRSSSRCSMTEIVFAMLLALALGDTLSYWLSPEDHDFSWLMWFAASAAAYSVVLSSKESGSEVR